MWPRFRQVMICSLYFRPVWEVTDASLACVLQDSTAARGVPCQLIVLAAFVFSCSMCFGAELSSAFLVPHVLCPARSCCTGTDQVYASAHVGTSLHVEQAGSCKSLWITSLSVLSPVMCSCHVLTLAGRYTSDAAQLPTREYVCCRLCSKTWLSKGWRLMR